MSLSLIGIIFVQGYWISNSIETKRGQFAFSAKQVLSAVSSKVQKREVDDWYNPLLEARDSIGIPDDLLLNEFLFTQEDSLTNETYIYRNSIVEQDYKLSAPVLDYDLDSIKFKRYLQRQITQIVDKNDLDRNPINRRSRFSRLASMSEIERYNLEQLVLEITRKFPIHKRVSNEEIDRLMTMELAERDMDTDFEFAVYSNSLSTVVRSENFDIQSPEQTFSVPLFVDDQGNSDYQLYANFPGEKRFVISSVIGMATLSILFTLIIVVAYSSALQQLIKQRQISQIKTDFINNMTHEFKTPIS